MSIQESDVGKIITEVEATSWRLREYIWVSELAATHRLGRMHRLRMLEEQEAWKEETAFGYIDTVAEMDVQRFRTNFVSEPFFYSSMFNPRWPHTRDEFTLEVDVERLRIKIVLGQPELPPPQCDPSPRRLLAVDTGSEEPGTPRQSPAIGTGLDEPGVSRAETQSTEREEIVPLQAIVDGVLRFNCTSPDQEDIIILLQPNVGVDDKDKTTTCTSEQAAAREEFARPSKKRQQQRMAAWTTE